MWLLWIFSMLLSFDLYAQEADWSERLFKPSDDAWVYMVGIGAGPSEYFALRESRRHAIASFVESHLSQNSKIALLTEEGIQGVEISDRVLSGVYNIDLSLFEKIDQRVFMSEGMPGYIRQTSVTVKALYRFPRSELASVRAIASTGTDSPEYLKVLEERLSERKDYEAQVTKLRAESERLYEMMFPLLGLDFSLSGTKVRQYGLFSFGMGLPIRLRFLSDRLQLRPFIMYGVGGSNTVEKTSEGGASGGDYETGSSLGLDLRFYLSQRIESGWFVTAQIAHDRVTPACPKRSSGECLGPAEPSFMQKSRSVGLGWVIPSERPMTLELLYGVPDNRFGVNLQINFSLIK
jgi:hypothetical protein